MKKALTFLCLCIAATAIAQQPLFIPQNVKKAFDNGTRSMDGKPGKKYWQNFGRYNISVTTMPPAKEVKGTETITYINNSPNTLTRLTIKLIVNIHNPGTARQGNASADYLTTGIHIDKYTENGTEKPFGDPRGSTNYGIRLTKGVPSGDSVKLTFDWHYDLSEQSGREGKLDSTSFFLGYFYPRVSVMDDVNGWDRMNFTDAQEFYNDFNDYEVSVTVPKNFLVWGTGDLLNANEVLQTAYADKFNKSLTSDEVINVVTQKDLDTKNITTQNATNTWKWKATNVSDMAYCISDHYVWDAASVVVDKKTGRRASTQAAFNDKAVNFHNQVKHIQHSLDWYSNNWPGVPYPFPKSTIIEGFADMEYPMMANDSRQDDDVIQRFIAEHEVGHSYFPFYMGINEHRYGFMDEGWTTAFENMIGIADLGKEKANTFFKQFRVNGWALNPSDETQIPIITPVNILSGQAMGENEYGKPALAYLGLKDMLGDDQFRKCLHGFMDRWHGKHPIPWDMFNSFSDINGKDLGWYWNNWFFTSNYMDVAADKVVPAKTGYTVTIKNIGGFAIPLDIVMEYADGTTETLHQTAAMWEKNQQLATIEIKTAKKISYLKLDGGIYVDANDKDNSWGTAKTKATAAVSNLDLGKYTGTYSSKQIPIKITFSKEDNKLVAEPGGQDKVTLESTGKDIFSYVAAGAIFEFDTTKNEMTLKQGGGTFLFTKEK
ncbi:M1 family metallopeptidase [Ferruginibacter profundus]